MIGRVIRQVFLGGSRDYLVEAADGTQIRITAPAGINIAPGRDVWLRVPPEHCRVLLR